MGVLEICGFVIRGFPFPPKSANYKDSLYLHNKSRASVRSFTGQVAGQYIPKPLPFELKQSQTQCSIQVINIQDGWMPSTAQNAPPTLTEGLRNLRVHILQGLRWCGFKGFDRTRRFLKKGSQTFNFWPSSKSKNPEFGGSQELRAYLASVLKKELVPVNSKFLRSPCLTFFGLFCISYN